MSKSLSRRNIFIPHPATKSPVIPYPVVIFTRSISPMLLFSLIPFPAKSMLGRGRGPSTVTVLRDGIRRTGGGVGGGRGRETDAVISTHECIPDKMNCQVDNLQSCYCTVTFLLISDKSMPHSRNESLDNSVTVDNMTASLPAAYEWRPDFGLNPAGYKRKRWINWWDRIFRRLTLWFSLLRFEMSYVTLMGQECEWRF